MTTSDRYTPSLFLSLHVPGVLPEVEKRRSREISPRDPATSTTFVRGSSGRSSWRMVPHSKRFSGDAAGEGMSGQSDKPGEWVCPGCSNILTTSSSRSRQSRNRGQ